MNTLIGMIPSILMIVSPILITAVGGMICEKSGVVNIALEGRYTSCWKPQDWACPPSGYPWGSEP